MLNITIQKAIKFIEKNQKVNEKYPGRTATKAEIELLTHKFGDKIPNWYYHLISECPIIHLEVGWQAYEPEEDFDGVAYVEIYEPEHMIDESFDAYPGIPILEKGYVCIGGDPTGSGDPYFVDFNSNDSVVYQIYHDVGNDADGILTHGRVKVADSLADLFENGIVFKW